MQFTSKRIAVLSPVAWRTPPRQYGAWETVASNITEGLVRRGWDVTLFATADSVTSARLHAVVPHGYEEDPTLEPKVVEALHISELMENAHKFDLIHNNYDFMPLTYSRHISTPMLTTIHGFSSPKILDVYRKYKDLYYVSISDSDRDPHLPYLATVYNGIDLANLTFTPEPGDYLVWLGRIHPDKGTHLAVEVALRTDKKLKLAGIVQDREYFEEMVKPNVDGKQIEYIGPVGPLERDELFKEAFCLLHLNELPERFGLVMAEANAAGVPVIAYDRGSCREVISDGETGYLVGNVDQAVEAVGKVSKINRRACRKRVEENFSIKCMVSEYEKVYWRIFELERLKTRKSVIKPHMEKIQELKETAIETQTYRRTVRE
ncbi:GDP-mannose-dependent alpha-(1-2)-phosphatidylinositol mannosyltransferase [Anaerohalosphaera lusitana]|uniref:GDP-mannose-dependent alpha-(1-2)-phosphatidylinositol mannosyltransferase n=1 Tax=Anaerohalosphaera lusitana TaxID=1936003 RepID=A0A1U9NNB6_9BACT|nr:glycosyltransferase family 4 protein [Anaerohalosphaera lusitana]AQT69234.1 GDP-mannose-dependent alpha-(1-2)-phosphatidylinositol mannosyltransferase [Anaerohalosphaera lusitana]